MRKEKVIGTQQKEGAGYKTRESKAIAANITDMWKRVKHMLDACAVNGAPIFRDIANVPAADLATYFDLPIEGDVDARLAKFNAFFEYVANFANGDGALVKPIYKDAAGNGTLAWLKLLPDYADGKYYDIPTFANTGFIEGTRIDEVTKLPVPAKIISVKKTESLELRAAGAKATGPIPGGVPVGASNDALAYLRNQEGK